MHKIKEMCCHSSRIQKPDTNRSQQQVVYHVGPRLGDGGGRLLLGVMFHKYIHKTQWKLGKSLNLENLKLL